MELARGVAVKSKQVDGAAGDAAEDIAGGQVLETAAELSAGTTLKTGNVGGETGNVGSGHGGTRHSGL